MELDENQQALLKKIRAIDDPSLLNLLADGAQARVSRYDESLTPEAKKRAEMFADAVEKRLSEAVRIHRGDNSVRLIILETRKGN